MPMYNVKGDIVRENIIVIGYFQAERAVLG